MCRLAPSESSQLLPGKSPRGSNDDHRWQLCWQKSRRRRRRPPPDDVEQGDISTNNRGDEQNRNGWHAILFGQSIALSLSCANAASSTLENDYQIKVPTFQTGVVYFLLSFHLVRLFRRHESDKCGEVIEISSEDDEARPGCVRKMSIDAGDAPSSSSDDTITGARPSYTFPFTSVSLRTPWHVYLLLALLDMEANYLAMLSFQHTSLSSSMLLTSLSVLSTVVLRQIAFRNATYGRGQLFGMFLCLAGGGLWLREEFHRGTLVDLPEGALGDAGEATADESGTYLLWGDFLALSAACLYGLNDVMAEYFVKANNDRAEYLGMLGLFGSAISFFIQGPLLEGDSLRKLVTTALGMHDGASDYHDSFSGSIFFLLCFIVLLSYFYMVAMYFLSLYDSTILNLSLQSCPLWAVVLTMVRSSMALPPPIFFVSLTMVIAGMFLYEHHSDSDRSDVTVGAPTVSSET